MTTKTRIDTAPALEALRVAEFPLLPENPDSKYVKITRRQQCGLEGILPITLFQPTAHDLSNPHSVAHDLRHTWTAGHVGGVMEHNLGPYGNRVGTNIVAELAYLSADVHRAAVAVTAARILVGSEAAHETVVAHWDDGQEYASPGALRERFSQDWLVNLFNTRGPKSPVPPGIAPAAPAFIVHEATRVFDGTVSVFSGDIRMDVSYTDERFHFEPSTTEGISGNLVVARIPHIPSVTHDRQPIS